MEVFFNNLSSAEVSTEKLVEDLTNLVHDAERLVHATSSHTPEASKQELMTAVKRLKSRAEQMKKQAVAGARATDRLIRDNPYRSLALIFGLGMIVGMIVNRPRSR